MNLSLFSPLPLTLQTLLPLLLLFGTCIGRTTSLSEWSLQKNYDDKVVGDSVSMTGQGMTYLATSDSFNEIVNIYVSYYNINGTTFGHVGRLTSKESGFGKIIDFYDDDESFEKTLFIGQNDDNGGGHTYIYSGSWNQWTLKQVLYPPSQFSSSRFSSIIRSDHNTSTLAVGCPYCNVTTYAGQVYLYQQDPDLFWINSQVLNAKYVDYLQDPKSAAFFLGGLISLDRNVLLASVLTYRNGNDFIWGSIIFSYSTSTGSWSQQQTITSAIYDATTMTVMDKNIDVFAVHDETIVFSTVSQPYQGLDGVGAVSILYPNTKRFTAPYTPNPTILTSPKSVLTDAPPAAAHPAAASDPHHLRSSASSSSSNSQEGEKLLTEDRLRMKFSQDEYLSPRTSKTTRARRVPVEQHEQPETHNDKTTKMRKKKMTHSLQLDDNTRAAIEEKLGFPISRNIETHHPHHQEEVKENPGNFQEFELPTGATGSNLFAKSPTYSTTSSSSSSKLTPRGLTWSTRQILYPPEGSVIAKSNFGSDLSIYRNTLIIGEQGTSRIYYYSRPYINNGDSNGNGVTTIGLWSHQQTLLPSRPDILFYSDNYLSHSSLMTLGLISLPYTSQLSSISMDFRINNQDWHCLLLTLEDIFGDGWGSDVYLALTTPLGSKFLYTMVMTSFETPNPFVIRYCPDEMEYDHYLSSASSSSSSSGTTTTYLIEIERGNQSTANIGPFFWEIQYRTQIERDEGSSGEGDGEGETGVVYGSYGTKVRYTFNWDTKSFEYLSSSRSLPSPTSLALAASSSASSASSNSNNTTNSSSTPPTSCQSCRVYAQSEIHYSGALVSDVSNWRYLNMFTNTPSLPWYNQQDPYHSTQYYLSDMYGTKLIYSGTMCLEDINQPDNGIIHSCWLDIPSDGTYLLRISGALYTAPSNSSSSSLEAAGSPSVSLSTHSWNFCHQSGYVNSHIYFTVSNSGLNCVINGIYPLDTYTSSRLQSFILIDGIFTIAREIQSVPDENSIVLLTAADRSLFSQALTSVLWNISPRDISVQQEVHVPVLAKYLNDVTFTLILNIQTASSTSLSLEEEYDEMKAKDYYYMKSLAQEIIDQIKEGVVNKNILRVLQSTTLVPSSEFFRKAVSLTLKEDMVMREEITLIPAAPAKDEVSFY